MADLAITAASVLRSSAGNPAQGTAAAAITQGQVVYITDASTVNLADSNAVAPANSVAGIALNSASTGQPILYVTTDSAFVPGFTALAGDPIYLSNTPGAVTKTYGDVAAGSTIVVLGVMTTTTVMNLSPIVGGVKA